MTRLKNYLPFILAFFISFSCDESQELPQIQDESFTSITDLSEGQLSSSVSATIDFLLEQNSDMDLTKTFLYVGTDVSSLDRVNKALNNELPQIILERKKKSIPERGRKKCEDDILYESYKDGSGETRWQIIAWDCPDLGPGAVNGTPVYIGIQNYFDAGPSSGGGGSGSSGGGTTPDRTEIFEVGSEKELAEFLIEQEQDSEEKRKKELNYIHDYGGYDGKDFKLSMEQILGTPPGLSDSEKASINEVVDHYYLYLKGQYLFAIYGTVANIAKPFIELALFEIGGGGLFQALKGVLSIRWGIQLAKLGINTVSVTTLTNRITSSVTIGLNTLTLKIGGRNLIGTAAGTTTSSKVGYTFSNVITSEAKAIFKDMTAGRQIKRTDLGNGKFIETTVWTDSNGVKNSITYRNFSKTGQVGDAVIDINMPAIRAGKVELKFFL